MPRNERRPRTTGAPDTTFTEIQSKAPDADFFAALRRARKEHPEVLAQLKLEASARQWEIARRRVARPIEDVTVPEVNVQIRELIRRCKARGRGEAVGTVSQSANMNRGTLPYWWAA